MKREIPIDVRRALARRAAACAASAWLAVTTCASAQERFDFDATPGVLPKAVVPAHYGLALELDPADERFRSIAAITLRVRTPVDGIVLGAEDLVAERVALDGVGPMRRLDVTVDSAARQ